MKINTNVMNDASEIIAYDNADIPLYIRHGKLSDYTNMKALCHWHEDIELIYILKGEMGYYINGNEITIKEHDGIIINSKQMHYGFSYNNQDCTFICIIFHPSLLNSCDKIYQKFISPVLNDSCFEFYYLDSLQDKDQSTLLAIEQIVHLKQENETGYQLNVIGLLFQIWKNLLGLLPEELRVGTLPYYDDLAIQRTMVSYIHQNYSSKLTLSQIASSGGVCKSKCCQIFKKYSNQSPIDFLNTYRLEVSKNLLKETDKNITEIATSCGFNHLSYYASMFQNRYGTPPSEYRKLEKHSVLSKSHSTNNF
ncbi:HTH-type transcriptional activator Btr [Clostridiales bacterium CHKCI001]|nr:HTH-type transcriptional activator Btr [Clostridiales bacterium CHKCI001]